MLATSLRSSPVVLTCLALGAACYNTRQVRPAELAKLQGVRIEGTATTSGTVVAVEESAGKRHLITPDGRTIEVDAGASAIVTDSRGRKFQFEHPVLAEVDGRHLIVRGANRPELRIPLEQVARAEVRSLDFGATTVAVLFIGFGIIGLLVGLSSSDDP